MLSIIITTYNNNRLQCCLQSLRGQTCKNFEIIIVNDGGDLIDDVVNQFNDLNIKSLYLHPPSASYRIGAARNLGLKSASGDYVVTLDADCVAEPEYVAKYVSLLEPGLIVAGLRNNILSDGSVVMDKRHYHDFYCLLDLARNCFGCNMGYPRVTALECGGYSEWDCWGYEDTEFAMRMVQCRCRVDIQPIYVDHFDHPPNFVDKWLNYDKMIMTYNKLVKLVSQPLLLS